MIRTIITLALIIGIGIQAKSQNLSLDSCKAYALENNKRIKEAYLKRDASEQVKKNAFTNYFPQIDAGATAVRFNQSLVEANLPEMNLPVYDGNPASLATATEFTYFPGMSLELLEYVYVGYLSASQALYAGGRIRNGNKLAALGEEFSEHQLNLTKDEVLVATEFYYWTILSLEEKKKTLQGYEKLLNRLMKDVEVAQQAGLILKSDLLKVQMEITKIENNKLKLNNGIDLLKMTLAQHIGIEYTENIQIIDTTLMVENPLSAFANPDELLQKREEFVMLNKAVKAEVLQKRMARGEYLPTLAVGFMGFAMDVSEPEGGIMQFNKTNGLAFATVSIPITSWWGGMHKIQEHQIKVDIAQNNLDEKSELLKLQMDKAYRDFTESYKQIAVAESGLKQAEEHLSVVQDNFNAGIVNTSDLLEAQAVYQQALDQVVDAKTKYKIKHAEYLKVTGRLR